MPADGDWNRAPIQSAAGYAALGLAVLPECAPTCSCSHPGKRPWDPIGHRHMEHWQHRRVPTGKEIDGWVADADAERLNIGCRCGPGCLGADGLIAADADGERGIAELAPHLGLTPAALVAALAEYRASGIFPLALGTAAYVTQSGGLRVLWRTSQKAKLRTVGGDKGHQGLRLMWNGQQIVLPDSRGPEGPYRWLPALSLWQVGVALAPASVLAAMSNHNGKSAITRSADLTVTQYPAAVGDLGPDRDGRLVDGPSLPYDLGLLRDGVVEGERSEGVFRLVAGMHRAGWPPEEIASVLGSADWIRERYGGRAQLAVDVVRIVGKLDSSVSPTPAAVAAPSHMHRGAPRASAGSGVVASPLGHGADAQPVDQADDEAQERAAIEAEGNRRLESDPYARRGSLHAHREPHCWSCGAELSSATHEVCRRCGWIICSCGACAEQCGAAEPGGQPRRLRGGTRLRSLSPLRDAAVRDGLEAVREAIRQLRGSSARLLNLDKLVARVLGSFDRCRHEAWAHEHALRGTASKTIDGDAYLWGPEPCDARGHEDCAPFHALRDLAPWHPALGEAYPDTVTAVALTAPGWGLRKVRKAASDVLQSAPVRRALGYAAGYLVCESFPQAGYSLYLLVPALRVDELAAVLLKAWRKKVPCGWLRRVDDLPPQASAMEALVELRVRSEQAIPLAVAAGRIEALQGARLLAEETAPGQRGGQPQRLVLGPGMRVLKRLRDDEASREPQALPKAAGAEEMAADTPSALGAQAPSGTGPATAGMAAPQTVGIPAIQGAAPPSASATKADGLAAGGGGTPPNVAGPPAASDDDEGWVPCPWDSRLEMKRVRRRPLPWWEVQRRVDRGELVPIIHEGRIIGYRTPPGRGQGPRP